MIEMFYDFSILNKIFRASGKPGGLVSYLTANLAAFAESFNSVLPPLDAFRPGLMCLGATNQPPKHGVGTSGVG